MKKDLHDKVVTAKPDWDLILASLINLSNKAANTVIRFALEDFEDLKLKWGDFTPFCYLATQKTLLQYIQTNNGTPLSEPDGQAACDNLLKLEEILF